MQKRAEPSTPHLATSAGVPEQYASVVDSAVDSGSLREAAAIQLYNEGGCLARNAPLFKRYSQEECLESRL